MEIKACPDCGYYGEEPVIRRDTHTKLDIDGNSVVIGNDVWLECRRCEWRTNGRDNVRDAIKAWNEAVVYEDGSPFDEEPSERFELC